MTISLNLWSHVLLLPTVVAFAPVGPPNAVGSSSVHHKQRIGWVKHQHSYDSFSSSKRFAYIFGIDKDETMTVTMDSIFGDSSSFLTDFARLEQDKSLLARIAAAFPPPGHSIQLKSIADVSVLSVHETYLELQAVVAEGDFAVTVAIPVYYPNPCSCSLATTTTTSDHDEMHTCVLDNLQALDQQAQVILQQQAHEEANYEEIQAVERQATELGSMNDVTLPSWWIPPNGTMEEESRSLKNLLNEADFRADVKSLAEFGIRLQLGEDYFIVTQAGLPCISPTGLMVKALIQEPPPPSIATTNATGNAARIIDHNILEIETIMVDIPIPFAHKVSNATHLRETVIDMLEMF